MDVIPVFSIYNFIFHFDHNTCVQFYITIKNGI